MLGMCVVPWPEFPGMIRRLWTPCAVSHADTPRERWAPGPGRWDGKDMEDGWCGRVYAGFLVSNPPTCPLVSHQTEFEILRFTYQHR
jgi:hypothetical protein